MQYVCVALALFALPACSPAFWGTSSCDLPSEPAVAEAPGGLDEPLACHETGAHRCCSWELDGCLMTFCASQFKCAWEYRKGLRLNADPKECPVPVGYVHLEVTVPESLRGLHAKPPSLWH